MSNNTTPYLTSLKIYAVNGELVNQILNDIHEVSRLVNDCFEFTGVRTFVSSFSTKQGDARANFFTEVYDSGDDDELRIRAIFDKAIEIGEFQRRFVFLGGEVTHG